MTDTVEDNPDAGNGNPPPKKPPARSMPAPIEPVEPAQDSPAESTDPVQK